MSMNKAIVQNKEPNVLIMDSARVLRAVMYRKIRMSRMPRTARAIRMALTRLAIPVSKVEDSNCSTTSRTEIKTIVKSSTFQAESLPRQKSRHPSAKIFKPISRTKMPTMMAFAVPYQLGTSWLTSSDA